MLRRPSVVGRCRPLSVRPQFSKIFFSKAAGPVEAKFHVEPPWVGGTKVCSGHLGHMTKMAATPIYGKNPSKILFSGTKGPMTLGPSKFVQMMTFSWLWPILWQGQICPFCFYMGKSVRKSFNGRNLQQMTRVTWGICLPKNSDPRELSAPALGLYTCIKTWKIMYKIRLQIYFFETCNKRPKWQGFSVDIRILSTKGCLPLPRGYIHVEKNIKNVYKIRTQTDLFETCNKWSKW